MHRINSLAVTACLKRCSIAVDYDGVVYSVNENIDAAANLVALAQKLCEEHAIDLNRIDMVITSSGPGSFTGTRVAHSFVKSLSFALGIPSYCYNYFDVIRFLYGKQHDNIVVVIRSEKNQAYYKIVDSGKFGVASYEELQTMIPSNAVVIGDSIPFDDCIQFVEINDFKSAVHLLNLPNDTTFVRAAVSPLYINAQKQ